MKAYLMSEIIELLNQDLCETKGHKSSYKNEEEYESEMWSLEKEVENLLNTVRWYLNPESDEEM